MKKSKRIIGFLIILPIIILAILFIYFELNDKNALTAKEKKYLEDNNKVYYFNMMSNYPVYSGEEGVFKSLLKEIEAKSQLDFSEISYDKEGISKQAGFSLRILKNSEKISDNDLLISKDNYVLISKNYQKINSVEDFSGLSIGTIFSDYEDISYYLRNASNINFKTFTSSEELFSALKNGTIKFAIVPHIMYLNKIFDEHYIINYTMTEMTNSLVLTISKEERDLLPIIKKIFNSWKEDKYEEVFNDQLFSYYLNLYKITDKEKTDLVKKQYVYGYVENSPYEVSFNKEMKGISAQYLEHFSNLSKVEFIYQKYHNYSDLNKAIKKKEVDIFLNYQDVSDEKYQVVESGFVEQYVVLARFGKNEVVNSLESLKDKEIMMIKNNIFYNFFKRYSSAKINGVNDLRTLVRENKDSLIVIDKEIYDYYKNKYFKDYNLLYVGIIDKDNNYMIKKDNLRFLQLFSHFVNTDSYYNYRNEAYQNLKYKNFKKRTFGEIYLILLLFIMGPIILTMITSIVVKKKQKRKQDLKLDRERYSDYLTNLKNRNYLNYHIDIWNKVERYPQDVIIIDLNKLKYINDKYGYEAGDQVIIKAASLLINNQLERSEIIRTDGNEFMIYAVGYTEKQIDTYVKKLRKAFLRLPYNYGAGIGYSIINDKKKSVDDAINEATLMMREDKEKDK